MLLQIVSYFGELMVLLAFGMLQVGIWQELDAEYLALNVIGSLLLVCAALAEGQVGYLLLAFAWTGLALVGVSRAWKSRTAS